MKYLSFILLFLMSLSSLADEQTEFGEVVSVYITAEGSDSFTLERGSVTVLVGDTTSEHYWGGSRCPGRDLSEPQVALLQNAALAPYMRVSLLTKAGQGGSTCVVGMIFKNMKFDTATE